MLSVKNLEKSYTTGKQTYPVLKGISFSIAKGEFVAVMISIIYKGEFYVICKKS